MNGIKQVRNERKQNFISLIWLWNSLFISQEISKRYSKQVFHVHTLSIRLRKFLYKIQRVIILLKSRSVLFKSWWNFGIVVFTLDSNPRSRHNYLNIVDFLLVWRHLYSGDLKVRVKIFLVAVFKRIFAISKFFYNIKIKIISRKLIISSSTINQLN